MPTFDGALGQDSVRPWVKWKRWTDRVDLRVFRLTIHHLPILTAAGAGGLFGNQKCRLHLSSVGENILHHIALTWEPPDNPHVELHVGMVLQALQAVGLKSSLEKRGYQFGTSINKLRYWWSKQSNPTMWDDVRCLLVGQYCTSAASAGAWLRPTPAPNRTCVRSQVCKCVL